jgi:predicted permease
MLLLDELRYALRNLRKTPVFTTVAIGSLALGIGANTAIFSLLDQVLLRTLPVKDPQELVKLYFGSGPFRGSQRCNADCISYPAYRDIRDRNQVFSSVLARWPMPMSFSEGDRTERVRGELASGNYFDTLGVHPAIGRLFTQNDDVQVNGHPLAILSYGFWQSRFAGDPSVLNRSVHVNGQPMTIVGVAARGFQGVEVGRAVDVFVPMAMKPVMTPTWNDLDIRTSLWTYAMARLKPGVSQESARASMQVLGRQILESEVGIFDGVNESFRARYVKKSAIVEDISKGQSVLRQQFSQPLLVLMGMVGLVLLIACANVANLLLARAAARQKEIAVRLALGAGRARVIRQLLVESTTLALAGGAAGLAIAYWGGQVLLRFLPGGGESEAISSTPDFRVLLFAFGLSLLTGILFGLVPALQSTRPALASSLKEQASNVSASAGQARLRMTLVAGQVALSLVLLIGAGLFARSLFKLKDVDPGFRADNLVSFSINPQLNGYSQPRTRELLIRLEDALLKLPGVRQVGSVEVAPLSGDNSISTISVEGFEPKPQDSMNPYVNWVGSGYFSAMGIPLLAGREFTRRDDAGAPKVAVINESMARAFFGQRSPLGMHIGMGREKNLDIEIVGVVRDGKYVDLREKVQRTMYTPWPQDPAIDSMTFFLRAAGNESSLGSALRVSVAGLDPNLPVYDLKTMKAEIDESIYIDRMIAALSSFFGGLATLLAAIGLYGVMAYSVTRRTREIGLRMALGAERGHVVWLVMREVTLLAGIGIAVALPIAYGLGRAVNSQLYGVAPTDFLVMAGGTVVLSLVAGLAGFMPAWRASRVDPLIALRYE